MKFETIQQIAIFAHCRRLLPFLSFSQSAQGKLLMLKKLNVLHTPDLLHILASMGHGDEIALVDANFPAVSMAQRLVRLDGADLPSAVEACVDLMPLDTFVDKPALRMMQVHAPDEVPEVQQVCQKIIDKAEGRHVELAGIPREEFYERAKKAFAVVYTTERRVYGCLLLKKGVVFPD
ncbi:MAG TPA: RbsD/FucU domain-containing protein [Acidobacteriaceae bacterium]|nr:RbsD/FucU domain-containing protein [Acidobacteriaceae bacterium]